MRLNQFIFYSLILSISSAAGAASSTPTTRAAAADRLVAGTGAKTASDRVTGAVRHASFQPGRVVADAATIDEKAELFLLRHGPAFGVDAPDAQLDLTVEKVDRLGHTRRAYAQTHRGVPVFGGRLSLHFDPQDELVAASGSVLPDIDIEDTRPALKRDEAARIARTLVAKQHGIDASELNATEPELTVFHDGIIWGRSGDYHLTWKLEVANEHSIREHLFIDATTGRVLNQIDGIEHINRSVYEYNGANLVWREGDPLPYSGSGDSRDVEINNLIEVAKQTHRTYYNLSGGTYLSWTGNDGPMRSFYDREGMSCPNAYFNGSSTSFCVGSATDDVIAHEWTHGYTQETHGLVYQWQPGALNEAYSDIFGEVVDLLYDSGSDEPSGIREANTCSAATSLEAPVFQVQQPSSIAGPMPVLSATFNPPPPWSASGTVELADDGVGNGNDACDPLVGFTPGNIALVTMGACPDRFVTPVGNAEAAGAAGVIVVNPLNDNLVNMTGGGQLGIPSVFLGRSDGDVLRDALDQGVVVSMSGGGDGSRRWLVAEDSSAFGGAIRDMWNPSCLGDPDRVGSANYYCGEGDNGGVHINSGVPNHAFALLVDGGEFNGVVVPAIGLTRATQIYWRAMTVYQFPLSDLRDHADALAASCNDLIGASLPDPLTGLPSTVVIDPDHCSAIEAAMTATEMRQWPSQCNFDTILDPDAPLQPGRLEVFSATFDSAPSDWLLSNEGVYAEYRPRDWQWTETVPEGGDGGAFYAINSQEIGDCRPGIDDQSGVMHLDSPPIELPLAVRPWLFFDHYVATEERVDGGNIKISVNGGPFELVPSEAFLFNPYNDVLREPQWNDNPIAGETAFVGTDATTYRGSWGRSQVDLGAMVRGGDTIVLRFDFGTDGCNGQDGWYIDNVVLSMEPRTREGGIRATSGP
jgi:Zn-dependent metalloprotease